MTEKLFIKTSYYLRTLQASNIEKSTIDVKKEARSVMGATLEPKHPAFKALVSLALPPRKSTGYQSR